MVQLKFLHTGLQKIIGKLMVYLQQMEFYLIMRVQEEVKLLLPEK